MFNKAVFRYGLRIVLITIFVASIFSTHTRSNATNVSPASDLILQQTANPNELILTVSEIAGVARQDEVLRSGVPIPRNLGLTSVDNLAIVDSSGTLVPAEFQVTARWNAGRNDSAAPIQWLLVTFPAAVGANEMTTYQVIWDGSAGANPTPENAVTVSNADGEYVINTGSATFVIPNSPSGEVLSSVSADSSQPTVLAGSMTVTVNGTVYNAINPNRYKSTIEHQGPLSAIIRVDGAYDMPPVGDGELSFSLRYEFMWNSPTVIVRQAVNWEGGFCTYGVIICSDDGSPEGLLIDRIDTNLTSGLSGDVSVFAVGSKNGAGISGSVGQGQNAYVRQNQRADRFTPASFDVSVPNADMVSGEKADGALLAVSDSNITLAVALDHMHRYDPQALHLNENGSLSISVADNNIWLGKKQGLFARMAVGVYSGSIPERAILDAQVWAKLNHPLHALPNNQWFNASGAVDEVIDGQLPSTMGVYDGHVPNVIAETLSLIDERGLSGLMTFGSFPRYWGDPIRSDEMDCGDFDPTPDYDWDDSFWCGGWTDYHNTIAAAPRWSFRSGDVRVLDELSFPGALRMLHTQILQCGPVDEDFYCGQAPAGYNAFRANFNGSHAYFENLFLYYWLTGDYTVVETLQRGANSMRDYLCPGRWDAGRPMCAPDEQRSDFWAGLTGRAAVQWYETFRFVGLASDDPSYLDDYKGNLARAVTLHYVQVNQNDRTYGFWLSAFDFTEDGNDVWPPRPLTPGTYWSDQLWMVSLYDMQTMYHYMIDTQDEPLGIPAIPPSEILIAWANTLVDFGSTLDPGGDGWLPGDGTADGSWPNILLFSWEGDRIGGTLTDVWVELEGDDPHLYDTGKSTVTAVLLRAGQLSGDERLIAMGCDTIRFSLEAAQIEFTPMGKIQGEYLSRMPMAIARAMHEPLCN